MLANDSAVKNWEALVEGIMTQTRMLLDGVAAVTLRDEPTSRIPLSQFAFELVHDPTAVEREVRGSRNSHSVKLVAFSLLARVLLNHLSACYQLLRVPLQQEAGILIRSLLEVVDLMEFIRSDRCTDDHLVAWWRGDVIGHGQTRKGATTMVADGALREQLDAAVTSLAGREPLLVEAIRKAQYRVWSRPAHHASREVAEATLKEFAGHEDRLAEHFSEFNSYLVWTLRAVPFYLGALLSTDSRRTLTGVGNDLANEVFDEDFDYLCRDLSEYYGRRALQQPHAPDGAG